MLDNSLEKKYPFFYKTCCYLQNSFFYRDIFALCERIPINYALAEKLCRDAFEICGFDWGIYAKKLDNLFELNVEFLKLQALLEKKGAYLYSTFQEVEREVFKNKKTENMDGVGYLWGLYFSEIFWVTHHRLFNFFLKEFVHKSGSVGRCLDVPIGSGIFFTQFLLANKKWGGTGVDLSKTSMDLAKKLFKINQLTDRVKLFNEDFYKFRSEDIFDSIMCIEFIEHVEDPVAVLQKLKMLLSDSGKIFFTTITWAAGIDHIYLYKNVGEIRKHINLSGLRIEKEYIQNIFDKDKGKLEDSKIALNYAAILTKLI